MPTFIAGLFLLYLLLAAIKRFGRITPADAAKLMRKGGVALGIAGLALTALRGRFGILGALASALLGLSGRQTSPGPGGAFRDVGAGAGDGGRPRRIRHGSRCVSTSTAARCRAS